jgi:hypothetical protein
MSINAFRLCFATNRMSAKDLPEAIKRKSARSIVRWLLLTPAYFLGLALLPGLLFVVIFYVPWLQGLFYSNDVFSFLIGFLSSFGGTAFPALVAPRYKQFIALFCCLMTAGVGSYICQFVVYTSETFTTIMNVRCLGYLLGGLLAYFFTLLWFRSNALRRSEAKT